MRQFRRRLYEGVLDGIIGRPKDTPNSGTQDAGEYHIGKASNDNRATSAPRRGIGSWGESISHSEIAWASTDCGKRRRCEDSLITDSICRVSTMTASPIRCRMHLLDGD